MSKLALQIIAENKKNKAKTLDLGNCGLTKIPLEALECEWIEELILSSEWWEYDFEKKCWEKKNSRSKGNVNKITKLPPTRHNWPILKKLVLKDNQISDLSPIALLNNLQELYCGNNQIADLSPIAILNNLQILSCSDNQISDLSPIAILNNLQQLSCASNQISDLLPIALLNNLQLLYCYENQISDLSPIALLNNLQLLDCSHNQISDLSPIALLNNLQELSCFNNQISDLSPIALLNNLQKLYCFNNQISDLSPIALLNNLQELYCNSNPIINPPPEIVEQGLEAIRAYFAAQKKQGIGILTEAKIVIVGAGGSGKTTLVQKLFNPEHPVPNPDDKRTEGIGVTPYPIRPGQPDALTAHLWDFGGQELYHSTHQFFLTPDTLYLLLNDNRKNDTDFYYWLNILALRAGDQCPILTIFNAKDGAPRQIVPDETLFQHFPGLLREAVDVDFAEKDLRRFMALKDRIEQHFAALPALGKPFPAYWVQVRAALVLREEEHISWAQFRDLCRTAKIEAETEMRVLAKTLHNLGVLLWFPEVFGLDDLLILQPQWCIDAVYKALDTGQVKDNHGQFTEKELHLIWGEERYRTQCNRLLKLMQHFDLCYPVEGNAGAYIAPQLLDLHPNPDPDFSATGGITHRFQYEFMPAGLLTRFIARMSRHIHAPHVWRTGVVLRWQDGTAAEVTENQFGKEITLRVTGAERKRRLSEMRQTLESIHSGFRGLKYDEKVACNCSDCVNAPQPTTFTLPTLEDYAHHGDPVICNNGSRKRIPAQHILDGIVYQDTPRIFISYAHEDKGYKNEFTTMLAPLVKKGDWKVWDEEYLLAGDRFNEVVLRQFSEANVIVLLLTAKFFNSDDKWDIEMSRAIERHQQGNALVIGVIVSPCMWEETPFRLVQVLPRYGGTVSSVANRDAVWVAMVQEIQRAIGVRAQKGRGFQ